MSTRRRYKKRKKHTFKKRLSLSFVAVFFILLLIYALTSLQQSNVNISETFEFKAAIVDHLSLTVPNQTFIETATNTLKQAGYTVDYYKGEEVTVEFYRSLPSHGYTLVILRVHSAIGKEGGPPVSLFTSEFYSKTRYVYEQLTEQLTRVHYTVGGGEQLYFAIFPNFVRSSMNGRFDNTIIVTMGCNGLTYTGMAEAFVEKGAKAYISWNEAVSASHTDIATIHLLQHFLIEELTLKEAIRETSKEVGPDPVYKSLLTYYPLEAGDYTIQNIISIPILNSTQIKTQDIHKRRKVFRQL